MTSTTNEFAADAIARLTRINATLPQVQQAMMEYKTLTHQIQELIAKHDTTLNHILTFQKDVTHLTLMFQNLGQIAPSAAGMKLSPGTHTHTHGGLAPHTHEEPSVHRTAPATGTAAQAKTILDQRRARTTGPTEEAQGLPPIKTEPDPATIRTRPTSHTDKTQQELERLLNAADTARDILKGAVAKSGPTEEQISITGLPDQPVLDRAKLATQVAGPRSVFVRMLSPEIIAGGRGFAKPGYGGLKQYSEDITAVEAKVLLDYPTGFYRNQTSGDRQLLLNLPGILVVYDKIDDSNVIPLIAIAGYADGRWNQITELDVDSMLKVHEMIVGLFRQYENIDRANRHVGDPA